MFKKINEINIYSANMVIQMKSDTNDINNFIKRIIVQINSVLLNFLLIKEILKNKRLHSFHINTTQKKQLFLTFIIRFFGNTLQ